MDTKWIYTAEADRDIEINWDAADVQITVDVEYEAGTDTWFSGLTHYRTPKDYEFRRVMAHLTLRDAIKRADSWAREIAADARMMAR